MNLEVEIERILPGGFGLAHADGKTIFVALAAPGDRLQIQIERQQGNVYFASLERILHPSPVRVEPPCPYFGRCGGCDFQQLSYDAQLDAKSSIIRDCLHRIGGLKNLPDFLVHGSPDQWHYRTRATWQIDYDRKEIGYYESGSRRVCDVVECAVLTPQLQKTLEHIRDARSQIPVELKHLEVVGGDQEVSLSPEFDVFKTQEIRATVAGEIYNFNARAFFQVNKELLNSILEFALEGFTGACAVDLYCGVGLFTLPLARRFEHVIAVEANNVATNFARQNLKHAGLDWVNVVTMPVAEWSRTVEDFHPELILLDPPRAGAESVVITRILELAPKNICYVSCDPATLARDLRKLLAGGYQLDELAGFDMFPQTHHIETIVRLSNTR